jgi:hypothetical protein
MLLNIQKFLRILLFTCFLRKKLLLSLKKMSFCDKIYLSQKSGEFVFPKKPNAIIFIHIKFYINIINKNRKATTI